MNLNQYKSLGVINRTPNSFSDKGQSLNQNHFETQLQEMLADSSVIPDFGFESTASMNKSISLDEEIDRFRDFLDSARDFSFKDRLISFDTYRPQSFLMMTEIFEGLYPGVGFIFNDVSGVLDETLKSALLKFKDKNFYYIYTFSHIPSRQSVQDHMKYLDEKADIIKSTVESFIRAYTWFKEFGMEKNLILDAGFGFSKTYEQNWQLINRYHEVESELISKEIFNPHLIGLSKKSFLKKALDSDDPALLEGLHKNCIEKIKKESKLNLLFRVHDPKILKNSL